MASITFELKHDPNLSKSNTIVHFDYNSPYTKARKTRTIKTHINDKKKRYYLPHLKEYIRFMIDHNIINESSLSLIQDKALRYLLFGYPRSYPHSKYAGSSKDQIAKYFKRIEYDRHILPLKSSEGDTRSANPTSDQDIASVYPKRLLAPEKSGKTTLILGSSFTGKTYLLCEELDLIKPYEYDLIILFTESVHVPCLDRIRNRPDLVIREGFDPRVPEFLKKLNSSLGLRYKFLLILDDIISEKSSRKSTLGKMLTTYRNSNISSCVLAQYPTIISKESRSNFHQLVLTGMRSPESNKAFADRFDVMSWARNRMSQEPDGKSARPANDEVHCYLKKLLMENGVILYIDLKRSRDPSLIDLR